MFISITVRRSPESIERAQPTGFPEGLISIVKVKCDFEVVKLLAVVKQGFFITSLQCEYYYLNSDPQHSITKLGMMVLRARD